jgi:two-component system response regulator AtoC
MLETVNSRVGRSLPPLEIIFGRTQKMAQLRQRIEKVASANIPVLIQGESGTGKDIIARIIHQTSPWGTGPFVRVTCPSIPGTLLESELFGYEKGSFTGATGSKPGRVETAEGGTLFLDEISELDAGLQSKLLQVLQDGQFCRIGATEDTKIQVRLVCATNRCLSDEIGSGHFRQDLFYRINGVTIELPALRERASDVPDLVNYFIETYSHTFHNKAKPISGQLMSQLQNYHWPGNIRELENLVKRYVIFGDEEALQMDLMPKPSSMIEFDLQLNGPISLKDMTRKATHELERKIILKILQNNEWNRKRTAKALNISYRALLYKIRDVGVPSKRSQPGATVIPIGPPAQEGDLV